MSSKIDLSRRRFLLGSTLAGAGAAFGLSGFWQPARADGLRVGFTYVGPRDDFGYNQRHAEGAAAVKAMDGVQVIEQENVPETVEAQKTMKGMIAMDGAGLLFPTSFGYYDPHILEVASAHPEVNFLHAGGLYEEGDPGNVGSYFGYIDQSLYVAGIVAGHTPKVKKLGYVAAKPIPQLLRNINSLTLGARSVDPEMTTQVVFTGNWAKPNKEAEAANNLIDAGADVLVGDVDSPKIVVETAEKRGVYSIGYHANQAPLAPKGYLTGAEWNWPSVYPDMVRWHREGRLWEKASHMYRGGLAEGIVTMSAYGEPVTDKAAKAADAAREKLENEAMRIYSGPMKDNKGNTVIPEGKSYPKTARWLEKMDWLVEGVKGSASV